jgi:hypothetical protein
MILTEWEEGKQQRAHYINGGRKGSDRGLMILTAGGREATEDS